MPHNAKETVPHNSGDDTAGALVVGNRRAAEMFACGDADALVGVRVVDHVVPEDRQRVIEVMRQRSTLAIPQSRATEYRLLRRNGSAFPADLDGFKELNDTFGHDLGDHVLQRLAHRLQATSRVSDMVTRLGGDEFGVLLPRTDAEGAVHAAEKIHGALRIPVEVDGQHLAIDGSIGIALYPEHGQDAMTLLRHVNVAMYRVVSIRDTEVRSFPHTIRHPSTHRCRHTVQAQSVSLRRKSSSVQSCPRLGGRVADGSHPPHRSAPAMRERRYRNCRSRFLRSCWACSSDIPPSEHHSTAVYASWLSSCPPARPELRASTNATPSG